MNDSPATSSRSRRHWFPGEQVAVTIALLVIFALVWRFGDRARQRTRDDAANAATREAPASTQPRSATGPGYGRREVATRPFEDLREVTNSVGMTLREVPRTLGLVGNADDPDGDAAQRLVKTDPFFIGTTEITRGQWKRVSGAFSDPSIYIGAAAENDELPVNNVDFPDAVRFCKLLSAREGRNYRLPTEYEWEIACWARRNDAIFACRAATKFAAIASKQFSQPFFAQSDARGVIHAAALIAVSEAQNDLIRLGYDPTSDADAPAFASAQQSIAEVERLTLAALAGTSNTFSQHASVASRIYDAVFANFLAELSHASYSRGIDAGAARFEDNSAEAWTHYGKYQASWWLTRDPGIPSGHPFGLHDMLGGMMEWTATPTIPYPYSMTLSTARADEVNAIQFDEANIPSSRWATLDELPRFAGNKTLRDKTFYIVRGGSFERAVESCTPWNRYGQLPLRTRFTAHRESLGFRVVLEP